MIPARTIKSGILWGLAWGLTLLAPAIIRTHAMSGTPLEAIELIAMMAVLFAILGAGIALGLFILDALLSRLLPEKWRGHLRHPLAIAVLIPAVYIATGAAIYFWKFRTIGGAGWYQRAAVLVIVATVGASILAAAFLFATSRKSESHRNGILTVAASLIAVIAAAILVARFPSPDRRVQSARPLKRVANGEREKRQLVVIGIDGGTWHVIAPLMKAGRLPTFSSIVERGIHGNVQALWPPYWSIAAWSAISTGHRRRDVGVFGDIEVHVRGLPAFQSPMDLTPRLLPITAVEYALASRNMIRAEVPNRKSLRVPPVWEYLDRSGIETAVVRWNFSYPATGQAKVVVSNLAMADVWGLVGVRAPEKSGLVEPASRRDELLAPFSHDVPIDSAELKRILPVGEWKKPADATLNPVGGLRGAFRFDAATINSVSRLLESDPQIEVLFVHLGGVDTIEHMFWQYRFSEEFAHKPARKDIDALGGVVDRYLEFVDNGIAKMIGSFPTAPNVLIVSDHGQAAREDGVPFKGWHASPGIFLAAGPDIPAGKGSIDVSYFDIVPTILDLKGLEKPADLRGRSLLR
ncbi:MAG TPA: alkaline phosphatase family protein [Gemmatimonadaceae bacterium]